mmetsp:Transcript_78506/g.157007  ORF Transcript_78506/g.157007 Transcript_78506/m.157007 type:complete len:233 (+) Transcript_78506:1556-2254(+)
MTECTDEGSVELTETEVQQGEVTTAAIVTLQAVRSAEVTILEQPVEPSAAALQEAVARAAARAACLARAGRQAATIVEAAVIASKVTTGMTEVAADIAFGVFGAAGVDDMTTTAVDNMEIAARAGEATQVTAVVEAIAGAAGMTEAAAYTTAGAAVAAGVAETTSMESATSTFTATALRAITGSTPFEATSKKKKKKRAHGSKGKSHRDQVSQGDRKSLAKQHSTGSARDRR